MSRRLLALFALALSLFVAACGNRGLPEGSPCTSPSMCQSRQCLNRPGGAVCARPCASSGDCTAGDICGRFDFRGFDPDTGLRTGPATEVVRVCRPPMTSMCSPSRACTAPGELCAFGAGAGVCAVPCSANNECPSGLCTPERDACGAATVCAPLCDDPLECPSGYYCNTGVADALGHGRCERITGIDDAGASSMCDASPDDAAGALDP